MAPDAVSRHRNIARLRDVTRSVPGLVPEHLHLLDHLLFEGLRLEAETEFEHICGLRIPSAEAFEALGFYARRLDQHERSNQFYRRATELAPNDPKLWHNLATSERSLGRLEEAVAACEQAITLGTDPFPTLLLRSECSRATSQRNHVPELSNLLTNARDDREKMFAGYALGKELHDLGEYSQAFAAFRHGAEARRRNLRYDVAEDEHKLGRITELYDKVRSNPQAENKRPDHIFIVGLPRSGTTLTERILLGLPDTMSNGETDNFAASLIRAASSEGDDLFERCAKADPAAVRSGYDKRANPRNSQASIIEKLPMNYLYAGAIANALPSTKIIWVRRHPVDSCFAMYRTLFAEAYPFSYDFTDLARYFAAYQRLMEHWSALMPETLIAIDYEELVGNPAKSGEIIAKHCNLRWTDEATDISRVGNASLTASASQIRENIYTSSSGIWERYKSELGPLVTELGRLKVI